MARRRWYRRAAARLRPCFARTRRSYRWTWWSATTRARSFAASPSPISRCSRTESRNQSGASRSRRSTTGPGRRKRSRCSATRSRAWPEGARNRSASATCSGANSNADVFRPAGRAASHCVVVRRQLDAARGRAAGRGRRNEIRQREDGAGRPGLGRVDQLDAERSHGFHNRSRQRSPPRLPR